MDSGVASVFLLLNLRLIHDLCGRTEIAGRTGRDWRLLSLDD